MLKLCALLYKILCFRLLTFRSWPVLFCSLTHFNHNFNLHTPWRRQKTCFFFQMFSEVINRNGCWAKMVGVIVEFFQGERFLNNLLLQTISSQCFLLLLPPTTWSTLSFLMYSRGEWYQKGTVRSYGLKCNGNVTPILLREKSHSQVFTSGAGTRCVL